MKHNNQVSIYKKKKKKEEASNTIELMKANESAQCEGPYLKLLGSEGEKERHSVTEEQTTSRDREINF